MKYKHQQINCQLGKEIHVFDGVLTESVKNKIFSIARNASYKFAEHDTIVPEFHANDQHLVGYCEHEYVNDFFLPELSRPQEIAERIDGLKIQNAFFNVSTPSGVNFVHTHVQPWVLLYYVNLHWPPGAFGETHFYTEDSKDVQYTSTFTPGRIVLFNGSIPHTIRPQSIIGPSHRFTLTMFLGD